jgi:hypothetical protein
MGEVVASHNLKYPDLEQKLSLVAKDEDLFFSKCKQFQYWQICLTQSKKLLPRDAILLIQAYFERDNEGKECIFSIMLPSIKRNLSDEIMNYIYEHVHPESKYRYEGIVMYQITDVYLKERGFN